MSACPLASERESLRQPLEDLCFSLETNTFLAWVGSQVPGLSKSKKLAENYSLPQEHYRKRKVTQTGKHQLNIWVFKGTRMLLDFVSKPGARIPN